MFRLMLNRHSQIVVPPECGYILWFYSKYRDEDFTTAKTVQAFVDDLVGAKKFETWNLNHGELMQFLSTERPRQYSEACALVHQFYAVSHGKTPRVWGDKNNYYISEPEKILQIFPKARFLFVVRDPRDVFASYLDLENLETASKYAPCLTVSSLEFAKEWARNLSSMHSLAQRLSEDRFRFVCYEEIVRNPEETLRSLLEFLDLDFEESVVAPSEKSTFIEREPEDTLDWKKLTAKPPDRRRIGRYLHQLNSRQLSDIATECGVEMNRFGYTI